MLISINSSVSYSTISYKKWNGYISGSKFVSSTESSLWRPHTHGCGAFYRSIGDLPGTTPLNNTDIPSSRMQQLSVTPQLVLGAHKPPLISWWPDLVQVLCRQHHLNSWEPVVLSYPECFVSLWSPQCLVLTLFPTLFCDGPWAFWRKVVIDANR